MSHLFKLFPISAVPQISFTRRFFDDTHDDLLSSLLSLAKGKQHSSRTPRLMNVCSLALSNLARLAFPQVFISADEKGKHPPFILFLPPLPSLASPRLITPASAP